MKILGLPLSSWGFPLAALLFGVFSVLGGKHGPPGGWIGLGMAAVEMAILLGAVFSAVHLAEEIGHRTGEPYGTLILTVAVTVIEVALLASIILSPDASPTLVRDTVFAVVMIVCNGLVGLCILVGGLKYREQGFLVTGASAYLCVLSVLAMLTLVLPNYTASVPGPIYSTRQLVFASLATIALYGVFLYIQTVRHKDYFVPAIARGSAAGTAGAAPAAASPPVALAAALLVAALTGIVLLAKEISKHIAGGVEQLGAPAALIGVIVALIVLLPESVTALKAARNDELQKSINLALGSSLATIGLTIPVVALVNILLGKSLMLGLDPQSLALLLLTMLVSTYTFGTGRTNILYGVVHLVIFAIYLFLIFEP